MDVLNEKRCKEIISYTQKFLLHFFLKVELHLNQIHVLEDRLVR